MACRLLSLAVCVTFNRLIKWGVVGLLCVVFISADCAVVFFENLCSLEKYYIKLLSMVPFFMEKRKVRFDDNILDTSDSYFFDLILPVEVLCVVDKPNAFPLSPFHGVILENSFDRR